MHVVFAATSVGMLLATVWMLADDHNRPWKQYQREFQYDIETWVAQARLDEQASEEFLQERARLQRHLEEARRQPIDLALVQQFVDEARRGAPEEQEAADEIDDQAQALESADSTESRAERRAELLDEMRDLIARSRFRENNLTTEVKIVRAELDKARADYDLAVGNARPEEELNRLKQTFDEIQARLEGQRSVESDEEEQTARQVSSQQAATGSLVGRLQAAKAHREELERIYGQITADETKAQKELADHNTKLELLHKALAEREPNVGKNLLEMPILDAFGSPLRIDQIWLPQLTLNNNFRDVARFDRCTTCHQAMDKTQPGSAVEPGYREEHRVTTQLATPDAAEAEKRIAEAEADAERVTEEEGREKTQVELDNGKLRKLYGFHLAQRGMLNDNDATVSVVLPETAAAVSGLMSTDVLEQINGVKILDRAQAVDILTSEITKWGQPFELLVRRGVPHPYSTHPRLDLFVGSMSPHPMGKFGCTICHQGQGSATSFDWSSHTPNSLDEEHRWAREYGWFNNHHWIFPMYPERFAESSCLKCHHNVTELAESAKFPEAPAPKLTKGRQLILDYGCYGCHEINGFDGPTRRIGPDLRNEPNYFAAAAQLLIDPGLEKLSGDASLLAEHVARSPEDDQARRRLLELVATDARSQAPKLSRESHNLEGTLRDVDAPGTLRKIGPSLRHVATKNSFEFLYDWIEEPHRFRPSTKMPRFFGLYDHLDGQGLKVAEEFEPIEVRAIAEYLLASSQPFEYLEPQENVEGSAERGKKVFEVRGCLACHSHSDFPKGKATQGPDLSRIGAKLATHENGRAWLYSWVREPNRYHARTVMPNTFLDAYADAEGNQVDPALDVTEYLMTSQQDWKPRDVSREMTGDEVKSLERLALQHLEDKFPTSRARQLLREGFTESQAAELKGDELALVGVTPENRLQKIVQYVGRRSISKYGCYGCHDIPGYEDAKPIGTGLADWGRKDPSQLAFENIVQYLHNGHGAGHGAASRANAKSDEPHDDHEPTPTAQTAAEDVTEEEAGSVAVLNDPFLSPEDPKSEAEFAADFEFFLEKIGAHEREGFIWQKLREPRSYDFKKTENKKYNERLRMPKFYFSRDPAENDEAIEAIMTFVLGLVSEPPTAQFVYRPSPRDEAIWAGRKAIEKFNCGGCHVFDMDRWEIEYQPGWTEEFAKNHFTGPEPEFVDYEFLRPHFTPEQVQNSLKTDRRGRLSATLVGAPVRDETTGNLKRWDDEGIPLEPDDPTPGNYEFTLYEPVLINGVAWPVGGQNVRVQPSMLAEHEDGSGRVKVFPARGGDLARLLYPVVVEDEKQINPNVKAEEAWGWLPPPLAGEGGKVKTKWLHNFLLDPHPIRPAAVLRMPKFNMSSAEAQAIANYFAARDNADYPYEFDSRTREDYLAAARAEHPDRLADALKIVTNNNYCVKCHLINDFNPGGNPKALAPQLNRVHERLRADFVQPWIANPKRFLPYTGMPVNIPHNMPVDQALFRGDSEDQLNGVVDLLMNFDRFTKEQYSVKRMVQTPPAGGGQGSGGGQNNASGSRQGSSE